MKEETVIVESVGDEFFAGDEVVVVSDIDKTLPLPLACRSVHLTLVEGVAVAVDLNLWQCTGRFLFIITDHRVRNCYNTSQYYSNAGHNKHL
jgi:hypothetical protein